MSEIKAKGNKRTIERLKRAMKEANEDGEYRVARRIHGIILNLEGWSCPEIANILKVHRSKPVVWIHRWNEYGLKGLLEGHRSGRPPRLTKKQKEHLGEIIERGPIAYGFTSGVWTSPMITRMINEEFGVKYHPAHVRRMLGELGFSVQRPRKKLALAKREEQLKWVRYTYPNLKKKAKNENGVIIFTDEASFRQEPTLYQTWARRGCQPEIPTTGQRNTQKYFGAINLYTGGFTYHRDEIFNAKNYILFLEHILDIYPDNKVFLIHDNAKYHKNDDVNDWLLEHVKKIEVYPLPPYSPKYNALEYIWRYTRLNYTHDRYFATVGELETTLCRAFTSIQKNPKQITGYLRPFY